jgi:hypothetical protein
LTWIGASPALAKLVPGVNDLATLYPEVAKEADGWDPSTVASNSHKRLQWCCESGHTWDAICQNRTRGSTGCPICCGQQTLAGFNDLFTLYPEVANEADGWDPSEVTGKSNKKLRWRCSLGHTWLATVASRTPPSSTGCPFCAGKRILKGFNDLSTLCPNVANEAYGWDPALVSAGSNKKLRWRCAWGHVWAATVWDRTPPENTGCPYCEGKKAYAGFNDLATLFPDLAKEADGWDPQTVTIKSVKKVCWRCSLGHTWLATVASRTPPVNSGCPYCSGRQAIKGFNDLATLFPDLSKEADGWDPSIYTIGSSKKMRWRCEKGHTWTTVIANRTPPASTGCPDCSEGGFKPSLPAWFYLLFRPGEQQFGITNVPHRRLHTHKTYGWQELEVVGPFPGDQVLALEKKLKKWLRKEVGLVPGTHENWFTASLEVQSLAELKARSGVETDLF